MEYVAAFVRRPTFQDADFVRVGRTDARVDLCHLRAGKRIGSQEARVVKDDVGAFWENLGEAQFDPTQPRGDGVGEEVHRGLLDVLVSLVIARRADEVRRDAEHASDVADERLLELEHLLVRRGRLNCSPLATSTNNGRTTVTAVGCFPGVADDGGLLAGQLVRHFDHRRRGAAFGVELRQVTFHRKRQAEHVARLDKRGDTDEEIAEDGGVINAPDDETNEPDDAMRAAEDVDSEERASAARIGVGTFVSWQSSADRAQGKVEKVVSKGPAESSDGYVLEATPDFPVFVIRVWNKNGNGYSPSETTVVHRNDNLNVIGALAAPREADLDLVESRKSAIATAERVTMDAEVRTVATDDGSLRIAGYAATFNQEATGLNFREMIAPGAFTRSLQSSDPVFLLVNHDTEALPLASTQSGTLRLTQDNVGLRMEADLDPMNPRAAELASVLSRGDVDKMSFAFTVNPDGETRSEGLRTLTDLNLYEVSVVTYPAYDSTSVGMRNADAELEDLEMRRRLIAARIAHTNLR
jgi:HK97 family phage prohead protease